jgi:hypothetical protein
VGSLQGADKLQARFRAIGRSPEVLISRIVIRGVANAKRRVRHKTRNLSRTIRPGRVTATTGEVLAGGVNKVGYAEDVERGTRPHIIRPKAGRRGRNGRPASLAWGGPRTLGGRLRVSGGVTASPTHFASVVHHPGTRAKPYLKPGLQEAVGQEGVTGVVELWNGAA